MAATAKSQTLKNSHAVPKGRNIIQRIEIQMDKRRNAMEDLFTTEGKSNKWSLNQGRYEGLAAALALLRSSSVPHEIERSNERLGIE